jgi:hypothetical protein
LLKLLLMVLGLARPYIEGLHDTFCLRSGYPTRGIRLRRRARSG